MTPLVGRVAEQRRIAALVDAVHAGRTQVLLISGPSGVGKSHLAGSVSTEIPTYTHLLLESEADVQFGAIDRLLDEQLPETATDLVALRGTAGIPTFAIRVVNLIEGLGEPFALVVDDLEYLDQGSQEAFWHVLRRLDHVPALFIATMRTLNGTFATRLLQHINVGRRGAHIELAPLDADGVQAFIRSSLFAPLQPRQLDSVLRATGGSPRLLRALVERIHDGGTGSLEGALEALAGDTSTIPRSWPDVVNRLAPAERSGLLTIALGGPLTTRNFSAATALLNRGVPDLGAVRATGLLDDKHLILRETTIAPAVASMSDPQHVLEVHAALGEVLGGIEGLRHRVAALDGSSDPELAADLIAGAHEAARVWDFALAFRLSSWACSVDPSYLPLACLFAIRTRRAPLIQSLERQVRALLPGPARTILLAAIEALGTDVLDLPAVEGLPLAELDDTLLLVLAHAAARLSRARATIGLQRMPSVLPAVRDELAARRTAGGDPGLRREQAIMHGILTVWMVFEESGGSIATLLAGSLEVVRLLTQTLPGSPALGAAQCVAAAICHGTMRNGEAAGLLDEMSRLPFVPPVFAVEAAVVRFKLAFLGGEWDSAHAALDGALGFALDDLRDPGIIEAQALSALVPLCRGEDELGQRLLDHAAGLASSRRFGLAMGAVLWVRAWVGTADDDPLAVVESLTQLWSSPLTCASAGPSAAVLRVRAHLRLGDPVGARAARDQLLETEVEPGALDYLTLHCDALIAAHAGDHGAAAEGFIRARRALEALLGSDGEQGLLLMRVVLAEDCARLLQDSGMAHGRAECTVELQQAVSLLWRVGARRWRERLEPLLADLRSPLVAPEPPAPGVEGFDTLTAREQEIAALVLGGATNRQIAAELVVSVRTVEFHVRNLLAKLGVASRVELRTRLGGTTF